MATLGEFEEALLKRVTTGASLKIVGTVVESLGKGQSVEVKAKTLEILGDSDAEKYPLQPKKHSLEFLREIAHLRFRTNTFGSVFRLRNALIFGIHKFFQEQNFLNIHSPIISASDAEGAGDDVCLRNAEGREPACAAPCQDGIIEDRRRGRRDRHGAQPGSHLRPDRRAGADPLHRAQRHGRGQGHQCQPHGIARRWQTPCFARQGHQDHARDGGRHDEQVQGNGARWVGGEHRGVLRASPLHIARPVFPLFRVPMVVIFPVI